jgi:hypothetical protein
MLGARQSTLSESRRRARPLAAALALFVLVGILVLQLARAAQRSSRDFLITIETIGTGGGASTSASIIQPDSSVGQASPVGRTESAGFRNSSGVVHNWTLPRAGASTWIDYEPQEDTNDE